jgi:hypothetical protein
LSYSTVGLGTTAELAPERFNVSARRPIPAVRWNEGTNEMRNPQDRNDDGKPAGRAPAEQAPGGRSGEGAASALEQLLSQDRQRQREGLGQAEELRNH